MGNGSQGTTGLVHLLCLLRDGSLLLVFVSICFSNEVTQLDRVSVDINVSKYILVYTKT